MAALSFERKKVKALGLYGQEPTAVNTAANGRTSLRMSHHQDLYFSRIKVVRSSVILP
jgi:hypothetical protein